mgnify:CR=1 FL=1
MYKIIVPILFVLAFNDCASVDDADSFGFAIYTQEGMLVDMSKFDGCGWVLEYYNNSKRYLEPNNISEFEDVVSDSMYVVVRYSKSDSKSQCMLGDVVTFYDIEKMEQ